MRVESVNGKGKIKNKRYVGSWWGVVFPKNGFFLLGNRGVRGFCWLGEGKGGVGGESSCEGSCEG